MSDHGRLILLSAALNVFVPPYAVHTLVFKRLHLSIPSFNSLPINFNQFRQISC